MKARILLSTLCLLLVQGCSSPAENSIPAQIPDPAIEQKLRSMLPKGWSLSTEENTFTLSRDEKVWVYVNVGWDVRGGTFEEQVKKNGFEENYKITLRFDPRLSDSEFQRLKLEREPFEHVVNNGARSKNEWSDAIQGFYKHKVPTYFTEKYSIFAEKSDDYPAQIFPETVLPECKQVLASLDQLFERYEKRSGRASDF